MAGAIATKPDNAIGSRLVSIVGLIGMVPVAWGSACVALLAAPWFGPLRPDPGAGAGPDVWDLNQGTTVAVGLPLLAVSIGFAATTFLTIRNRRRGSSESLPVWLLLLVLACTPAWAIHAFWVLGAMILT